MANEATVSAYLSFVKGTVDTKMSRQAIQFTVAGTNYIQESMTVPTTAGGTAIPLGSVGTPGFYFIKNNDATNFVTILSGVGGTALLKLKAGEFTVGRFSVATPAALANTLSVQIEYLIVED